MLKAILSYSKKVPAEAEYSSQGYSLSLETELPEGLGPAKVQERIHQTFELVKAAVENELAGRGQRETPTAPAADSKAGGERKEFPAGKATNKQLKYLTDLAREQNITLTQLNEQVHDLYGVDSIYSLSKGDASKLVDSLRKDRRKAA